MLKRAVFAFHNLRLKYKLIIAISFVCLVALVMFSGTTVIFYKNMMTDKEIRSNLTNLRAFRDNLNNYLNGIDKSSVMLIYSPAIQDHLSENSNLLNSADRLKAYQDIYQKLKEISNNSYGISSVTIIDNYNNVFAIGDSSLTLPDASESSYGDLPWFRDAVRLNGVYRWDITDWSPSKKTIQMIRSIKSIRNQQTLGVVMFTIAPDILKSFFTSGNRAEGEYGIVVEDGAMYSNYPTDDQRAMIDAAVMKDEYGHYFASAGGRKYIVTYSSDPLTNWKFINMIEQSVLFKDITSIYWIWAIFFAATFLLIVLISWSIAKKISAPLKTLTTLNKKVEMGNLNVRFMSLYHDEVGVLGRSFNRMLDNIQEGLPLRREKILRSILEQNMSKDEFLALNRSTVLPLHNDFYQVCLLDFSPDLAPDRLERMERQLEQCEENAAMVWFTLKPGQICLIFNDNKEETNRIADKLVQDFHAWGIAATVYIGGDYPDIYFVKNSFEEAKDLIQYRFFSDSHCIRYEAIMARTWQMAYPDKYEKQLRFYIEQADLAQCRTLIDKLQAFTRDNHIKPVMIQMLLANIYIYLHQLAQKRNVDPQLLFDPRIWHADTLLDPHVSFQQHFDELTAGIEKYIRAIVEHGPKPVSPVIRQALSIMERDYHRSDLGIDYMARTLNLNGVYFSQLFKKEQGLSFTEALNQIRLGHAQRLLKQSQLKIKEIAGEVGYADPHYFGIWFKDKTGLTPLQFRKQNQ